MKKILALVLLFASFLANAQTFNPSSHTVVNDAIGQAQAAPIDGRTMFWDGTNFVWRPFQSTAEVLSTLPLSKYRFGNAIIVVNSGGVLNANGTFTGGANTFWMFKDGTAFLQAGGGIVYDSDPTAEYQETVAKLQGAMRAIDQAELVAAERHTGSLGYG